MKKNSIISLILAAVIAAGTFTGCGGHPSAPDASGDTRASGKKLDTSKNVELVMYVIGDRPTGQNIVDQNFNQIIKKRLNCTLKIDWIPWATYANKYPLLFSSGETFDMAYSATWLNFYSMAQKGAFRNLDELWPQCAPKNFSAQSKAAKQEAKVNGHYYCVPTLMATYSSVGPFYRTDIMKGTNWNGKMDNFADVEAYCDIVKKMHPEMEPLDIYSGGSGWDDAYLRLHGYQASTHTTGDFLYFDPTQKNPKLQTLYEIPQMRDFLDIMARWNKKGFFTKSALSDTDSTKLQNGKAAMKTHNLDDFCGVAIGHPEYGMKYSNFDRHVSHLPYVQDSMVISNTSVNPERSMALWDLITSDREVFDAFMYGVKGTTYSLNDKGQYKMTDKDKYSPSDMWAARTTKFNRDADGTPDSYSTWKQTFEKNIVSDNSAEKYAAFTIDTSKIETEYDACGNVEKQYWAPLALGYTNAKTGLAEYKQKMEAAGIEKVRTELQKQLDTYVAGMGK